jgi:quinol monooxygenase YgiN
MWAQLIKFRVKPDTQAQITDMIEHLVATEQPDSGLLREIAMSEQRDPTSVYVLALFESEEKARERERDPRRTEALQVMQAKMAEVLAGPPEFIDLEVLVESTLPSRQTRSTASALSRKERQNDSRR